MASILNLLEQVERLPAAEREIFERIFDVRVSKGYLVLPDRLKPWVKEKFGAPERVEEQTVVRVTNLITWEGTLFNDLRGLRPVAVRTGEDLDRAVEDARESCKLCFPEEYTPADVFGRVSGERCVSAGNVAKYDGLHGLIVAREHHPLRFDEETVADYFSVAARWFREARAQVSGDGVPCYYFLMWNCLWPAGSSVVHGHLQVTLTRGLHYPRVEYLRRVAEGYRRRYGSNYFEDLYRLYRVLGLGWESDGYRFWVSLTPLKEREVWIQGLSAAPGEDGLRGLGRAVGSVLRGYLRMGVNSFNVAVYLPPEDPTPEDWSGFPLTARTVDRGDALSRTADFGGMELYAASVVSSDPFTVVRALRMERS